MCRKHGVGEATFYAWRSKHGRSKHGRSKYGGMEVSDARKLKGLEEENAKLKTLRAELMLDVATLREMLGKNW